MSNWAGGVLTAAGRTLQAKVEAGLTSLDITKIKLGDGTESMSTVDSLIDLVSPKVTMGVSSATQEDQTATIQGIITTSQIASGFYSREWGLFADDPDAGEILYMITIDSQPEWIPPSTSAAQISATYAMNIAVANATEITAQIDLAGLVDVDMLSDVTYLVKRGVAYTVGELAIGYHMKTDRVLICITAGTTSSSVIDWSQYDIGDTVTDGTVTWLVTRYVTLDANGGISPDTTDTVDLGSSSKLWRKVYAGRIDEGTYIPGAFNRKVTFNASGSYTAPVTGVYRITLQGGGGGGAGAGNTASGTYATGSGGGSGATLKFYETLTSGTSYSYTIGGGGAGGAAGSTSTYGDAGSTGGSSSITVNSNSYVAGGGGGGKTQASGQGFLGGESGSGKINNVTVTKGFCGAVANMMYSTTPNTVIGAGGGGAGGAAIGAGNFGGGGAGGGWTWQSGTGTASAGSAGGDGYIEIEWYDPTA